MNYNTPNPLTLLSALVGAALTAVAAVTNPASPCLDYAGAEFKKYLPKAEFAIAFKVEESMGTDAFRVKEKDGQLLITAGNGRGCLYGVYSFLEKEGGAGFYASWCEKPPRPDTTLRKGLDYSENPAIPLREAHYTDFLYPGFAAKLRLNADAFTRVKGDLAGIGGMSGQFDRELRSAHTFFKVCNPKTHFKDHPEYFSMIDGKRVSDRQLCLSNPEVLRLAIDYVMNRIEKSPDCTFFGISQNDGRGGACECPACKAIDDEEGSHSGTLVRFINAIACEVGKKHPDAIIETLAYTYTRHPPKKTKPAKNVMICFCSIECDFSKPLVQSAYAENRRFCEDLRAWSAMTDTLYIWDYTTNYGHYLHQFPNVYALQDNIRLFIRSGCYSLFEQGNCQALHSDFGELKLWLLAKWMWNPELPMAPLLKEFFDGYYGPAAKEMHEYFDLCHAIPRDEARYPLTIYLPPTEAPFTDGFYENAEGILKRAGARVDPTSVHGVNVKMAYASICYSRMIRLLARGSGRSFVITRDPAIYDSAHKLNEWGNVVEDAVNNHGVRLSEFHNSERMKDLEHALTAKPAGHPVDECRIVRDGKKTYPFAFTSKTASIPASQIACDPGVKYTMFAKIRIQGPNPDKGVIDFNLYDANRKKAVDCRVRYTGKDVTEGVREYVGWTHTIQDGQVPSVTFPHPDNAKEFELLEVGFRRAEKQ